MVLFFKRKEVKEAKKAYPQVLRLTEERKLGEACQSALAIYNSLHSLGEEYLRKDKEVQGWILTYLQLLSGVALDPGLYEECVTRSSEYLSYFKKFAEWQGYRGERIWLHVFSRTESWQVCMNKAEALCRLGRYGEAVDALSEALGKEKHHGMPGDLLSVFGGFSEEGLLRARMFWATFVISRFFSVALKSLDIDEEERSRLVNLMRRMNAETLEAFKKLKDEHLDEILNAYEELGIPREIAERDVKHIDGLASRVAFAKPVN